MVREKQHSDLTFKYNAYSGRHGWLRLTPAYSVKMVDQIINSLGYKPVGVLEPFSGTGTTELECANRGIPSYAFDVNPFLVWLASTKTAYYTSSTLEEFLSTAKQIAERINNYEPFEKPTIYNIGRWWKPDVLDYLSRVKTAIWAVDNPEVQNLLKVVFCRIVIELSNASFNHVSTSFGEDNSTTFSLEEKKRSFITYSELIFETAKINPEATTCIYQHDSTILEESIASKYDTVITSPPYPNRISYIRELRPYMYWLDYLKAADDASDLDWNTIGGTWGAATSKLSGWTKQTNLIPGYILEIADAISAAENKSSRLMANYVRKYFDDMALHFQTVFLGIRAGGTVHYIVGNSNFYGNTVPSERAFVDMLTEIGFKNAKAKVVRKRNCNKALFEYWVSANKE